jgi:hypothetical protein
MMHVQMTVTTRNAFSGSPRPGSACPYHQAQSFFCAASVMSVAIDNRKKSTCCNTEDFDRCPLFLAKILRGI